MKQYEAVISAMEGRGGFSTFAQLYQDTLKIPGCQWKTKTPFASIRRIVQDERFFFRIRPGLWALKSQKDDILRKLSIDSNSTRAKKDEFSHTYFQGLLVEIGNIMGYQTFIPYQDKNKPYLSKPLAHFATLKTMLGFSFPQIVKLTISIDVSWFNDRNFPYSFFEVEHTTDINRSLSKFVELQDFNAKLYIVADSARRSEFSQKITSTTFNSIRKRVKFIDYNNLSELHSKISGLQKIRKKISL